MKRAIAAILAGLATWIIVATVLNLLTRVTWPDYAAAEKPMTFTLSMLVSRLATGALCSIAAGFVAGRVTRRLGMPEKMLAVLLLLLFIPVHYQLWDRFPGWYHVVFLGSLIPLTLLGATWANKPAPNAPAAPVS